MPQLLAIEWDADEARLVVAQRRGRRVVIEHAFSVELSARSTSKGNSPPDIGARLSAALASRGIRNVQTLLGIGRASIELKLMNLPPAPKEELPELVHFQAQRDFGSLGPDFAVDYIPLAGDETAPHTVLAAAISRKSIEEATETCHSAELKPRRLLLRPCSAASLLNRQRSDSGRRVRLLVDLVVDEADVTVTVEDDVVFMRTVRLPSETNAKSRRQVLLGEIRRSMAAVQNQLGGDRVEAIYFCGKEDTHRELIEEVRNDLEMPAQAFDPFDSLELGPELRENLPERSSKFAPLLGMLLDEAEGARHAIDFLHPRQRATSYSRMRVYALAGVAAALLIALGLGSYWLSLSELTHEIETAQAQIAEFKSQTKETDLRLARELEMQNWLLSDINWLDHLYELSENAPPSQDVMLTDLVYSAGKEGGSVSVDGVVRDISVIDSLEDEIDIEESRSDERISRYPIGFAASKLVPADLSLADPLAEKPLEQTSSKNAVSKDAASKKASGKVSVETKQSIEGSKAESGSATGDKVSSEGGSQ